MYRNTNELYHYGVIGMKWGVRRYQNSDGTMTAEGRSRYLSDVTKKQTKAIGRLSDKKRTKRNEKAIRRLTNSKEAIEKKYGKKFDKIASYENSISSDYRDARNKDYRQMTTFELNKSIDRLRKERDYLDLRYAGEKALTGVMTDVGKVVAANAILGGSAAAINVAINKQDRSYKPDYGKIAEYVAPNPHRKKK